MAFSGIFMACSDDEKVDPCVEIIAKSTEKVTKIAEKYAQEQTAENCKAYKKAIEEYLVATKECPDATPQKYKEVLKTLNCEELEMKENIVGNWVCVKFVENGKEKLPEYMCATKKDYWSFSSNGKASDISYREECKEYIDTRKWTLEGNTLSLISINEKGTDSIDTIVFTVKELNSKSMVLLFVKNIINGKEEGNDSKKTRLMYLKRI